jgi:RNA polymerase sigma factor (sigma-70 family)
MSTGVAPDGRVGSGLSVGRQSSVVDVDVADLLARAAGGSQSAWDEIVRRYERLVWSVARSHRLDSSDAADVVQTTWLRLVEHLGSVHDPERLGAWLATTARRESLRVIGRRKRELGDGADDELAALPDVAPGVEESLLSSERDAIVLRAVRRLDDRCQRLLRVLSASPPPRYEAVAEAFAMPIGSIGPTRGRCLQRLKDALTELGWS